MAFGEFSHSVGLGAHRRFPALFSPLAGAPQLWGPGARAARGCTCPGAPGLPASALAPGGGVDEPESGAPGEPARGADTREGAEDPRRVGARERGFGPSPDVGSRLPRCLRKEASPGRSGRRRPGAAIGGLGEEAGSGAGELAGGGGGELPGRRGFFCARAGERAAAAVCFDSRQLLAPLAALGK